MLFVLGLEPFFSQEFIINCRQREQWRDFGPCLLGFSDVVVSGVVGYGSGLR